LVRAQIARALATETCWETMIHASPSKPSWLRRKAAHHRHRGSPPSTVEQTQRFDALLISSVEWMIVAIRL